MNVFLMGFMGSGKSSLGKKLARKLDRPFLDLDQLIEEKEGKEISEIFRERGEECFRKLEQDILFGLDSSKKAVIALGGGSPCNDLNWNFLEQNGLLIYLKEEETTLLGRLRQNRSKRPLVSGLTDDELKIFVEKKLQERKPYYEKAHLILEDDKTSLNFLVKQIGMFLNQE